MVLARCVAKDAQFWFPFAAPVICAQKYALSYACTGVLHCARACNTPTPPLQLCVREWACGCCARNSVDLAATAAAVPRRIPLPYCFVKSSAQLAETHGLRSGAKRKGFRCCSRYADALGEIRGKDSFAIGILGDLLTRFGLRCN